VEFEKLYEPVFSYVFSDTLVVKDLETARGFMGRHRLVTLDGDLVERSGAMTGGARGKSRWRFTSQEEDRLETLQARLGDAQAKRDGMLETLNEAIGQANTVEDELTEVSGYSENLRLRLSERQLQINRLNAQVSRAEGDVGSINNEVSGWEEKEEQALKSIAAWDRAVLEADELQSQLSEKMSGTSYDSLAGELEEARDEDGHAQRQLEHNNAQAELLSGKVEMARSELEAIKSGQKEQASKKLEREELVSERLMQIKADTELIQQYRAKEKELEGDLAQLKRKRDVLEERRQKVDDGVRELESDRATAISELNSLEFRRDEQAG
jgi:chromosome segregation protein